MQDENTPAPRKSVKSGGERLNVLLAARLAVISFFMGLVVFYLAKHGSLLRAAKPTLPMVAAYIISIIYSVYARYAGNLQRFVFVQFIVDVALIDWVIIFTGGVDSPFSFLFIFAIIGAAIFLSKAKTYIIASAAAVTYGLILDFEYFGFIHPIHIFPPVYDEVNSGYFFLKAVMNIGVFYLVAYLSGYLTGLLSRTDQQLMEQSRDFTLFKAFHENVIENMGSGFIAVDMNLITLSHNPAAERILGLKSAELTRRRLDEIIKISTLARNLASWEALGDYPMLYEWTFREKESNDEKNLAITITKFTTEGERRGFLVVFQDITEQKRMERQVANAERMAAIGRVAAGIAHEIRNPLASLSGSIQMLSADLAPVLDVSGKRLVNIITREAERLNGIITQFLQYTSPAKIKPEVVDTGQMAQETAILLKADPRVAGRIELTCETEHGLLANVDPEQLRQVLWNLCVNAIDAMENGGALKLTASRWGGWKTGDHAGTVGREHFNSYVLITVEDTGEGMPQESLDKIFEPFYTTKSRGTGLGLPTAAKIVESHKGKISAVSEPGKGTIFSVWLPAANGDAARIDSASA